MKKSTLKIYRGQVPRIVVGVLILALLFESVLSSALAIPLSSQTDDLSGDTSNLIVDTSVKAASGDVYLIRLKDDPVASYDGSIVGLKATKLERGKRFNAFSPAAQAYVAYLKVRHDRALDTVGGQSVKLYDYFYTFNGFASVLTPAQAQKLAGMPDVLSVQRDFLKHPATETSPEFLGLSVQGGLWENAGGFKKAGEDVIIGVIDTGVWPEHPSFSDQNDLKDRPGASGKRTSVYGPPPSHWKGTCQAGELWSKDDCNNKLIGARYYLLGMGHQGALKNDYLSARDAEGHGTHTASTAGGNYGVSATLLSNLLGTVSGMAPRARIAAYKACWHEGCYISDLTAAIDQAVADGVDVISYSIGSNVAYIPTPDEIAFLFAADAGVFVSTSAGNAGPGAATLGSPAVVPWVTTVGANTHNRIYQGSVTLGNGATYYGASITGGTQMLPLVDGAEAGSEYCIQGQLDSELVAGKIVLCRGFTARRDKSKAVELAGGVGMILYNDNDAQTLMDDTHFVPSVHITNSDGLAVKAYIQTDGHATAYLSKGIATAAQAPVMGSFSSRGPNGAVADIVKPDLTAPGINILAGQTPDPLNGVANQLFQVASGTSMSAPHVSGVAAVLKQLHRDWSPAMIKSALMTTGLQDVVKEDGVTPADPFDIGGGHIHPTVAADPGLVYDVGSLDYIAFLCGATSAVHPDTCNFMESSGYSFDASDLNLASIGVGELAGVQTVTRKVTNVGDNVATYSVNVDAPDGINVDVTPDTLNLLPGQSINFTVTFTTMPAAAIGSWAFGSLTWSDGTHNVRSPIAVRPVPLAAPGEVSGVGSEGILSYDVNFGYTGDFDVSVQGLIPAVEFSGNVVDDPENGINKALASGVGITLHSVIVEPGTRYARFSLFDSDTDGEDDLDLYVFGPDTAGFPYVGGSGSGTSAEEVNLIDPVPGLYKVIVHGWQTDGPDANYILFTWTLKDSNEGNMDITAPEAAVLGSRGTVSIDWLDLGLSKRYLGSVAYSDGSSNIGTTFVRIDSGS
jgi:subtilisin family serine protease